MGTPCSRSGTSSCSGSYSTARDTTPTRWRACSERSIMAVRAFGDETTDVAEVLHSIGGGLTELGRYDEAIARLRRAAEIPRARARLRPPARRRRPRNSGARVRGQGRLRDGARAERARGGCDPGARLRSGPPAGGRDADHRGQLAGLAGAIRRGGRRVPPRAGDSREGAGAESSRDRRPHVQPRRVVPGAGARGPGAALRPAHARHPRGGAQPQARRTSARRSRPSPRRCATPAGARMRWRSTSAP